MSDATPSGEVPTAPEPADDAAAGAPTPQPPADDADSQPAAPEPADDAAVGAPTPQPPAEDADSQPAAPPAKPGSERDPSAGEDRPARTPAEPRPPRRTPAGARPPGRSRRDPADTGRGAEPTPKEKAGPYPSAVARYGMMRQLGLFRHNFDEPPAAGTKVVVRTERGVELGEVVIAACQKARPGCITHDRLGEFIRACGPDYPFRRDGKVLRLANVQDIIDHRHLESSAVEEGAFCRQQIRELGLKMKLVTVEHLLGGERIIFYFSAEQRVDFRELVRRLAAQFRTRIEMRQVGARDEARLVADYERCGMQCCCQQFLKDLKPVSMRMAKTQKATLDPSKISGRCGRLMCCLRYEDVGYEDLRQKLPRKNTWVRTAEHCGRVVETQILTQLVRLALPDKSLVAVANEQILERDLEPPPPPEASVEKPRSRPRKRSWERAKPRLLRDQVAPGAEEEVGAAPAAEAEPKETPAEAPQAEKQPQDSPEADESRPERRPPRRRRRRRRPKKKGAARGAAAPPHRDPAKPPPPPEAAAAPAQQTHAAQKAEPQDSADSSSAGGERKKPARRPRRRKSRRRRKK